MTKEALGSRKKLPNLATQGLSMGNGGRKGGRKGGRATIESHGPQLGNGGRKSSSDSLDEILSSSLLSQVLALAQALKGKMMPQVSWR